MSEAPRVASNFLNIIRGVFRVYKGDNETDHLWERSEILAMV